MNFTEFEAIVRRAVKDAGPINDTDRPIDDILAAALLYSGTRADEARPAAYKGMASALRGLADTIERLGERERAL